jgi:leucyl aminopeptidase
MENNRYLMAARAVAKKLTEHGNNTTLESTEGKLMSNMISFELKTENASYDFFNKRLQDIFKTIQAKELYNIKYLTHSIKGNNYWILYLILNNSEKIINEIVSNEKVHQSNEDKLKELYLTANKAFTKQKTRRKSCRDCESIINLDAFFSNYKFKYKKMEEALKCPICFSEKGFYSKTINDKINKLKK